MESCSRHNPTHGPRSRALCPWSGDTTGLSRHASSDLRPKRLLRGGDWLPDHRPGVAALPDGFDAGLGAHGPACAAGGWGSLVARAEPPRRRAGCRPAAEVAHEVVFLGIS